MLVEREEPLAALHALLAEAAGGSGRIVFLGGEAGVGKTSLIRALLLDVPAGISVRQGGCDNLATPAAFGPLLDALPEAVDEMLDAPAEGRIRLFHHLLRALTERPALLIVEDVHWADEATLELLRFLSRRIGAAPLMIVATFRADEVGPHHPLTVLLGDLATVAGVVRMQLLPLTVAGVRQVVEHDGSPADPVALHRYAGGNPFYVTEVLAAAAESVPLTVRDAVLARASRLSDPAREVLLAMAILGARAEPGQLTAVSGQPDSAIEECLDSGMIVPAGSTLSFRHELARVAMEQTLSPGRRADLHGKALAELRRSDPGDDRRLAYHAAGCGDRAAVAEHAPRAAARAAALGAHREAAEHYAVALEWLPDDNPGRADLLDRRAYECYLTGQSEPAHACRQEALALYVQAGDHLRVGETQRWLSRLSWFLGHNEESERHAADAVATLEPLGDRVELAMAYSNLAQLRMLAGDNVAAIERGTQAIELARRLGDVDTEIHALNNVGTARICADQEAAGWMQLEHSLELALAGDWHEHAARAYTNLGSAGVVRRRYPESDRWLRTGIEYCQDRDLDSWRLYMSAWLARSMAEQGHAELADLALAPVLRDPQAAPIALIPALAVAGQLAARRGRDPQPLLDRAAAMAIPTGESQRLVPVAAARAEAAWLAGAEPAAIVAAVDIAWSAAVAYPLAWELGELAGWLRMAGQSRPLPIELPAPFALMVAGDYRAAGEHWQALSAPIWAAYAFGRAPELADARLALELLDQTANPAGRAAILRDRHQRGLVVPRGPRATSQGNPAGLTAREIEVLALLADGLSNAEIAHQLYLSEKTVGHHVSAVLRKLAEPTRSRAVATALRQGIVTAK